MEQVSWPACTLTEATLVAPTRWQTARWIACDIRFTCALAHRPCGASSHFKTTARLWAFVTTWVAHRWGLHLACGLRHLHLWVGWKLLFVLQFVVQLSGVLGTGARGRWCLHCQMDEESWRLIFVRSSGDLNSSVTWRFTEVSLSQSGGLCAKWLVLGHYCIFTSAVKYSKILI